MRVHFLAQLKYFLWDDLDDFSDKGSGLAEKWASVRPCAKVEHERDDLYSKFENAIFEVQQKSGLKNLVLERKLEAVGDQLEKKEAQLGEVLSASNLDPGTLQQVTKKLDEAGLP